MANLTVNDILTDAYQEGYASPDYKTSNTLGLKHIHLIVQEIWSKAIKYKKSNNNWDIWVADTVSLQDEYSKPSVTSTSVGSQHIESVSVAYSSDTFGDTGLMKYIPCKSAMDYQIADWNNYLENQPKETPIFFERDGSIFIAPDPRSDEIGTNRVQIKGIRSIASGSWTTATTEQDMKLPLSMIDTIKLGLVWKINSWHARDRAIIIDAKNEYIASMEDAIANMYTEQPFTNEYPQ